MRIHDTGNGTTSVRMKNKKRRRLDGGVERTWMAGSTVLTWISVCKPTDSSARHGCHADEATSDRFDLQLDVPLVFIGFILNSFCLLTGC